jgi:hypothetical protein
MQGRGVGAGQGARRALLPVLVEGHDDHAIAPLGDGCTGNVGLFVLQADEKGAPIRVQAGSKLFEKTLKRSLAVLQALEADRQPRQSAGFHVLHKLVDCFGAQALVGDDLRKIDGIKAVAVPVVDERHNRQRRALFLQVVQHLLLILGVVLGKITGRAVKMQPFGHEQVDRVEVCFEGAIAGLVPVDEVADRQRLGERAARFVRGLFGPRRGFASRVDFCLSGNPRRRTRAARRLAGGQARPAARGHSRLQAQRGKDRGNDDAEPQRAPEDDKDASYKQHHIANSRPTGARRVEKDRQRFVVGLVAVHGGPLDLPATVLPASAQLSGARSVSFPARIDRDRGASAPVSVDFPRFRPAVIGRQRGAPFRALRGEASSVDRVHEH